MRAPSFQVRRRATRTAEHIVRAAQQRIDVRRQTLRFTLLLAAGFALGMVLAVLTLPAGGAWR